MVESRTQQHKKIEEKGGGARNRNLVRDCWFVGLSVHVVPQPLWVCKLLAMVCKHASDDLCLQTIARSFQNQASFEINCNIDVSNRVLMVVVI